MIRNPPEKETPIERELRVMYEILEKKDKQITALWWSLGFAVLVILGLIL